MKNLEYWNNKLNKLLNAKLGKVNGGVQPIVERGQFKGIKIVLSDFCTLTYDHNGNLLLIDMCDGSLPKSMNNDILDKRFVTFKQRIKFLNYVINEPLRLFKYTNSICELYEAYNELQHGEKQNGRV